MARQALPNWISEPRIVAAALKLPALLLGLDGIERLEERDLQNYLHRLLAVSGERRGWEQAARDYLTRRDFRRAVRCVREVTDEKTRADLQRALRETWEGLEQGWRDRLAKLRAERERLAEGGADVSQLDGELDALMPLLRNAERVSGRDVLDTASELDVGFSGDIEDGLDLAFMALEEVREDFARQQKEILARLREFKRRADDHLDEMLWWESDGSDSYQRLMDAASQLRTLLDEAVRSRDMTALETLWDIARRLEDKDLAACDEIQSLHTPRRTPPKVMVRHVPSRSGVTAPVSWASLSELARQLFEGVSSQGTTDDESISLDSAIDRSWNTERMRTLETACRTRMPSEETDRKRLVQAHFLLAVAKLQLLDGNAVWSRVLFTDAYRFTRSAPRVLGEHERTWHGYCACGLLLSMVTTYLPAEERRQVLQPSNLDVLFLMRSGPLFLARLEQMGLFPRVAIALLDMESSIARQFFNDYLSSYLEAHPTSAEAFLHTLLASHSLNLATVFVLFAEVFRAIGVPFADDIARQVQRQQLDSETQERASARETTKRIGELRAWLLQQSEWTHFITVVDRGLQTFEEYLRAGQTAPPELNIRLLTPELDPRAHDFLILELHYLRGTRTLSDIRVDVLLRGGDHDTAWNFEARQYVSLLLPGDRRESRIPLGSGLAAIERDEVKLDVRAFEVQSDGSWRILRTSNLTLSLRPDERRITELHSPYTAGKAVTEIDGIFGRDEQIQTIIRALVGQRHDNAVLVLGERRIGKTTLLVAVTKDPIIRERYLCVRVDLEKIQEDETVESFYRQFLIEPVRRCLEKHEVPVPVVSRRAVRDNPAHAFSRFMESVDRTLQAHKQRVLIILDEFERLLECIEDAGKPLDVDILATLRAVIISRQQVSFILCGVTHVLRRHTARQDSRLFHLAVEVELKPLDRIDAANLVREPARPFYLMTPTAVDRIVRETGRQPYLIQYICHQLFQRMMMSRRPTVATATDVGEVFRAIISRSHAFSYLLEYLKKPEDGEPPELDIVQALAERQYGNSYVAVAALPRQLRFLEMELDEARLSHILASLCERATSVCERKLTTHDYRLSSGLFAAHLRARRTEEVSLIVHSTDDS